MVGTALTVESINIRPRDGRTPRRSCPPELTPPSAIFEDFNLTDPPIPLETLLGQLTHRLIEGWTEQTWAQPLPQPLDLSPQNIPPGLLASELAKVLTPLLSFPSNEPDTVSSQDLEQQTPSPRYHTAYKRAPAYLLALLAVDILTRIQMQHLKRAQTLAEVARLCLLDTELLHKVAHISLPTYFPPNVFSPRAKDNILRNIEPLMQITYDTIEAINKAIEGYHALYEHALNKGWSGWDLETEQTFSTFPDFSPRTRAYLKNLGISIHKDPGRHIKVEIPPAYEQALLYAVLGLDPLLINLQTREVIAQLAQGNIEDFQFLYDFLQDHYSDPPGPLYNDLLKKLRALNKGHLYDLAFTSWVLRKMLWSAVDFFILPQGDEIQLIMGLGRVRPDLVFYDPHTSRFSVVDIKRINLFQYNNRIGYKTSRTTPAQRLFELLIKPPPTRGITIPRDPLRDNLFTAAQIAFFVMRNRRRTLLPHGIELPDRFEWATWELATPDPSYLARLPHYYLIIDTSGELPSPQVTPPTLQKGGGYALYTPTTLQRLQLMSISLVFAHLLGEIQTAPEAMPNHDAPNCRIRIILDLGQSEVDVFEFSINLEGKERDQVIATYENQQADITGTPLGRLLKLLFTNHPDWVQLQSGEVILQRADPMAEIIGLKLLEEAAARQQENPTNP